MGKTVTITNSLSPRACFCYFLDLNVLGIRGEKLLKETQPRPLYRNIIKHVQMRLEGEEWGMGGFGEVPTYSRSQTNPSVE